MNPFLTDLINYLAPTAGATIICAAIACAAYLYQIALQKLPANVRVQVESLADTVVQAVEQKYALADTGSALKKQDALTLLTSICTNLHIPLDLTHASAVIEAAVYTLNRSKNVQPALKHATSTRTFPAIVLPDTPIINDTQKPDQK
jgi:hypothetical protein